jgi:hypothetical protein
VTSGGIINEKEEMNAANFSLWENLSVIRLHVSNANISQVFTKKQQEINNREKATPPMISWGKLYSYLLKCFERNYFSRE